MHATIDARTSRDSPCRDLARAQREPGGLHGLSGPLTRLDALLEGALHRARAAYGEEAIDDPYRGLYIAAEEVERLLRRLPGAPLLHAGAAAEPCAAEAAYASSPAFRRLRREFALSPFDLDLLLIALGPELDLRYERLYAFLQDDVTRRRPSVDLALNLLCADAEDKLARRAHVAPGGPLVRHGLIRLVPEPDRVAPLLAHGLRLDPQALRVLIDDDGEDERLAGFAHTLPAGPGAADGDGHGGALVSLVRAARKRGEPLRLYLHGPRGSGRHRAAFAVAAALERPLVLADLALVPPDADAATLLGLLFREVRLLAAPLCLTGLADLSDRDGQRLRRALLGELEAQDRKSVV